MLPRPSSQNSSFLGCISIPFGILSSVVVFNLCFGTGRSAASQNQIEVIWQHAVKTGPLPLGCQGTSAIGSDGSIYVPAGNFLYALNPDGSEKWSRGKESGLTSLGDVAVDDKDTIYAGSDTLCAFTPEGSLKWKIPDTGGVQTLSIAIGDGGTIYFVRRNKLCAASAEGAVKWERDTGILNTFAPVVSPDGAVYTKGFKEGPRVATIHAFDSDGTLKRVFQAEGIMLFSAQPAIDDIGDLYFGTMEGNFYAVDSNAQLKWIFKTEGNVALAPAIAKDHTIYLGSADGNLYALNPNGELRWKFHTNGPIYSAPAIDAQGNIYFTSRDHNFYCLDSNGSLKDTLRVTAGYGSPIIGADGTIYLVDVGFIYAIRGFAPPNSGPWPMKRHDAQGTGRISLNNSASGRVKTQ